jgi:hypothetical protein
MEAVVPALAEYVHPTPLDPLPDQIADPGRCRSADVIDSAASSMSTTRRLTCTDAIIGTRNVVRHLPRQPPSKAGLR